jgi:hypothetical protein
MAVPLSTIGVHDGHGALQAAVKLKRSLASCDIRKEAWPASIWTSAHPLRRRRAWRRTPSFGGRHGRTLTGVRAEAANPSAEQQVSMRERLNVTWI